MSDAYGFAKKGGLIYLDSSPETWSMPSGGERDIYRSAGRRFALCRFWMFGEKKGGTFQDHEQEAVCAIMHPGYHPWSGGQAGHEERVVIVISCAAAAREAMIFFFVLKKFKEAVTDLLPIIVVIAFFQIVVLHQPLPQFGEVLIGALLVVAGLTLFVQGLEMGLFPIGEAMAQALARKGSLFWLLCFAFALGFSTTVAEPALIAIAAEAAEIAGQGGLIASDRSSLDHYALGLRLTVAFSVGLAILIGVLRILRGWPVHYLIIGGYILVMLITIIAPKEIIGIAYDAGGVTTSTITVPLVAALGVGLASTIRGRSPLIDGFGLIAFASLLPVIFVMGYGLLIFG